MAHVSAIVRAAVARFSEAWKNIELDEKAIDKLYNHLYGSDKALWQSGYEAGPPVRMNFDVFATEISEKIIDTLSARKDVFAFFARALALQDGLKATIENRIDEIDLLDVEQSNDLIHEAQGDSDKNYIITRLTGQVESPVLTVRPV